MISMLSCIWRVDMPFRLIHVSLNFSSKWTQTSERSCAKSRKSQGWKILFESPFKGRKKENREKRAKSEKLKKEKGIRKKHLLQMFRRYQKQNLQRKKKRKEQTLNRPFSRGTYLVSLLKLHYQQKNQTEERNKATKKMQQKMLDSAGCGRMC